MSVTSKHIFVRTFQNHTDLAVMNMFHGVKVPIPCNNNIKYIIFNLSCGGFISNFARSIVIPINKRTDKNY